MQSKEKAPQISGHYSHPRVSIETGDQDGSGEVPQEVNAACQMVVEALGLRDKYLFVPLEAPWSSSRANEPLDPWHEKDLNEASPHEFRMEPSGIFYVYSDQQGFSSLSLSLSMHRRTISTLEC